MKQVKLASRHIDSVFIFSPIHFLSPTRYITDLDRQGGKGRGGGEGRREGLFCTRSGAALPVTRKQHPIPSPIHIVSVCLTINKILVAILIFPTSYIVLLSVCFCSRVGSHTAWSPFSARPCSDGGPNININIETTSTNIRGHL